MLEEARERERERATLARLEHEHVMGLGMYADLAPQRRAERKEAVSVETLAQAGHGRLLRLTQLRDVRRRGAIANHSWPAGWLHE